MNKFFLSVLTVFYFSMNFSTSLFCQTTTINPVVIDSTQQTDTSLSFKTYDFPQVDIIGSTPALINRIPGSANLVTEASLQSSMPVTGNEVFKKITGLNVVEEEGVGLRANIGIRGLDPDRSRNVLMMEDGVPIALAPYGEPEMYYTPAIDRMESVEILKGSGSILFGPQTIGGVINYITYDPPLNSDLSLLFRGGEGGFLSSQASYGNTIDNIGFQVGLLHKQADKLGITNFNINDLTAKLKFPTGVNSKLGIKLAYYDETSNSTYVGLTQGMFDNEEYFTLIAPEDELEIKRYFGSITHDYFLSSFAFIRTTLYGYTTTRNWQRQDFNRAPTSNGTAVVFGDTTISGGAIYMRNTTANRNRKFEVAGIEPRITYTYFIGNVKNDLEGGFRLHYERAYEQRVNGTIENPKSGRVREDEIRTGTAQSIFAQNRIYAGSGLSIIPGIRFENFQYERDIYTLNYNDTTIVNNSSTFTPVPGLGINYELNNQYSLFAGVHRGYAPPRTKDAITSGGVALDLDSELSWNYELGLRASVSSFFYFEITGFIMDFSNQIIPVSESSGGLGTGLVNGGETLHRGVESSVRFNFHKLFYTNYLISLSFASTYTQSTYSGNRYIQQDGDYVNIKGNELPYSPDFTLSGIFDFSTPFGFSLNVSATYVGSQFTDELNTIKPSPSGESGLMESFITTDLTANYFIPLFYSNISISVKNLFDERYIASRRPQGIKVGIPRFLSAGIEINL